MAWFDNTIGEKRKAQRLTDLIVNEASLVDRPANEHAR